jgi:predicted Zn-dependent peptidase
MKLGFLVTATGRTLAVLVALVLAAGAQAAPRDLLEPEEGKLRNGLRVLTLSDPSAPVLSFQVWYDVGSRNERPGITGISHFFEHLMFTGSEEFGPDEHGRRIEQVGGSANSYTTWDVTVYDNVVPAEHLELCAELEADRMRSLQLTEEKLEAQRRTTLQERQVQIDSQPIGLALESLVAAAFDSHPYSWVTLGLAADVEAITLQDLQDFFAIHYAPDKATIVVCGSVSHEEVMKVVKRHFGRLKKGRKAPEVIEPEAQDGERRVTVENRIRVPLLIAGYKLPPDSNPDTQILEMTNRLLVGGAASRLQRSLVEERKLGVATGGSSGGRKDVGLFYVFVAGRPGGELEQIEAALLAEIELLATEGPTEAELARLKQQVETEYLLQIESPDGRSKVVGNAALVTGDATAAAGRIGRTRTVTAEDIQRVVREYLIPSQRTLVWLVPQAGGGS